MNPGDLVVMSNKNANYVWIGSQLEKDGKFGIYASGSPLQFSRNEIATVLHTVEECVEILTPKGTGWINRVFLQVIS
jgi:hypothetical protein